MYEVFYDFKAEPFRLSPDHRFCYEHKSYAKARAYMAYAFKRAEGFVMITGRPGTGKTTLIGELVESLSKDRVYTANLVCTQLQADDLLKTVAFSFGIASTGVDKADMLQRLTVLLHRWHREGRRALLIVDEAQDLSTSAMEELRLLTNIQIGGQPLLQIFLLGQPELRDLILSPAMEQVHQRIVAASHIEGLGVEETEAYVVHRLAVVGWRGDPAIDRGIFPLIHKFSEGVPRRINLICSRLFLLGSVEQRHDIRVEDVRVVITELQAENLAAGTGISEHDFDPPGGPEWVSVPQSESRSSAGPKLHAVDSAQGLHADELPSNSPTGAKKKDNPGLTLAPLPAVEEQAVEEQAVDPGGSSVYFGQEPGYDLEAEPPSNEYIDTVSTTGEGHDDQRRPVQESRRGAGAPALWRRPFFLGVVTLLVLTMIFLAAYSSNRIAESGVERLYIAEARERRDVAGAGGQGAAATAIPMAPREQGGDLSARPHVDNPREQQEVTAVVSEVAIAPPNSEAPDSAVPDSPGGEVEVAHRELAATNVLPAQALEAPVSQPMESSVDQAPIISVNFNFDSDNLIPDSHGALDKAVMMLRDNPDSIAAITGFTDKQGDEEYNLALSRKRANAVKQYLVGAGIAQERLSVEGRGAHAEFVGDSASEEQDDMEPYRVVQIRLSGDHSL